MKNYSALCLGEDCYNIVKESDIERKRDGIIYERSKLCWDCRTVEDRKAIKRWRKKHRVAETSSQKIINNR